MASKAAPRLRDGPAGSKDPRGPHRPESGDFPVALEFAPKTTTEAYLAADPGLVAEAGMSLSIGKAEPDLGLRRNNTTSALSGHVLVLNASFEPINVCSVRRAVVLILKEKAEVIDEHGLELHAEKVSMTRPSVIRLVNYVRIPFQSFRRRITRRAVFARDGWECQYCGRRGSLTMDHVIPRSRGGGTSWENVVACCAGCNRRKGDRSLSQAGMKLRSHPRTPHATIFIHVASPTIPVSWQPYVPDARTKLTQNRVTGSSSTSAI